MELRLIWAAVHPIAFQRVSLWCAHCQASGPKQRDAG